MGPKSNQNFRFDAFQLTTTEKKDKKKGEGKAVED